MSPSEVRAAASGRVTQIPFGHLYRQAVIRPPEGWQPHWVIQYYRFDPEKGKSVRIREYTRLSSRTAAQKLLTDRLGKIGRGEQFEIWRPVTLRRCTQFPTSKWFKENNARQGFLEQEEFTRMAAEAHLDCLWMRALLEVAYSLPCGAPDILAAAEAPIWTSRVGFSEIIRQFTLFQIRPEREPKPSPFRLCFEVGMTFAWLRRNLQCRGGKRQVGNLDWLIT